MHVLGKLMTDKVQKNRRLPVWKKAKSAAPLQPDQPT
jgi:hypothetical protein